MKKVKLGIIGIGNMGTNHAKSVVSGKCPDIQLCAVADINPDRLTWAKDEYNGEVACFADAIEMLDSGLIDACLIAVPHYDHCRFAIECIKRGIHVMVEKPAGVYTKQVREMNAEAEKHPEVVFGMMFNQRTNCVYSVSWYSPENTATSAEQTGLLPTGIGRSVIMIRATGVQPGQAKAVVYF